MYKYNAYRNLWRQRNPVKMQAQRRRFYLAHPGYFSAQERQYPEWHTWYNMIQRCTNSSNHAWKYYGGRGIKVCKRWLRSFEMFLKDMGKRPADLSLDRINNDRDYKPSNCRWTDRRTQMNNRRLPCHS